MRRNLFHKILQIKLKYSRFVTLKKLQYLKKNSRSLFSLEHSSIFKEMLQIWLTPDLDQFLNFYLKKYPSKIIEVGFYIVEVFYLVKHTVINQSR